MYAAVSLALVVCFTVKKGETAEGAFSYDAQEQWSGECTTGRQQSPVNIATANVEPSNTLTELNFNSGWNTATSGQFKNLGTNVQFIPTSTTAAFSVTFLGDYDLQQFHMHWGATSGTGSEHRINGGQSEVEIHFVHFKRGESDNSRSDYAAVIGVLADIADEPVTGIWAQLSVSAIQSNTSSPLNLTGLVFNNLLPTKRSYYYYPGSLTTPGCNEIVRWFVLSERITVPRTFVEQLRTVEQSNGEPLTINYRDAQPLNGRTVQVPASQSFNKPALLVLLVTIFLTAFL